MEAKELPARPSLDQYRKQAKELLVGWKAQDPDVMRRVWRNHPRLRRQSPEKLVKARFTLADAQLVVAREHTFETWPRFTAYIGSIADEKSQESAFERAADAIVNGDIRTLRELLDERPGLVHERSRRFHESTLLHYVSANGVEDYRQKSPANIVEIAELLIKAGADVDACSDAYKKSTTLGLVASSYPPQQAGVQIPLLELLVSAGASVEGAPGGWKPLHAALQNGRGEAARFLADRGAKLDLEDASGVGRLDVVETYFDSNGNLRDAELREQMRAGLAWASQFGWTDVVGYLLDHGVPIDTRLPHHRQTALHWAAFAANGETVRLLLRHGAPVNARDEEFDGTPLEWALYAWGGCSDDRQRAAYYAVVSMLVEAGAKVEERWLRDPARGVDLHQSICNDDRMLELMQGSIEPDA